MKTKDGYEWSPGDRTYWVGYLGTIQEYKFDSPGLLVHNTHMHRCNAMLEAAEVLEKIAEQSLATAKKYREFHSGCRHQAPADRDWSKLGIPKAIEKFLPDDVDPFKWDRG